MKNKKLYFIILMILFFISILTLGTKVFGLFPETDVFTKMRVFTEVLNNIKDFYVDEKNPNDLIDNAIRGMIKELDPHTVILPPERSQLMDDQFQGFGGIGIWFNIVDEKITIMDVFKNGPCDKLGLMRGDQIIKINGESVIGIKRDDVAPKLKGAPNTSVEVYVERPGWSEPKKFTIIREDIQPESVIHSFMLTDEIGYIGMDKFSRTTVEELDNALKELEGKNVKKLILDLRENPGGYLPVSVGVADIFLPGGKKIVYTKGRTSDSMKEYYSTDNDNHPFIPMIILIDEGSASASEIVSGALQDWDRALIIGTTSFGKALVQTPFKLRDESRLLLTTARYYTPAGRLIQKSYEGKTSEQYYRDAREMKSIKDLGKSVPDSLTFKTNSGRVVYGGGGIIPDIIIEETPYIDSTAGKLFNNLDSYAFPFGLGFTFLNEYAEKHSELRKNSEQFIKSFQINNNIIDEFKSYLKKKGIEINEEEFNKNLDDVKFLMKCELAHQLWGVNEFWQVFVQRDTQLKQAITHFKEAEQLINKNYSSYIKK